MRTARPSRRSAFPLLLAATAFLCAPSAWAVNTEKDVINGQTDLTAGASYVGGGTPGATWDVTFTNVVYAPTAFTMNANETFDSIKQRYLARCL